MTEIIEEADRPDVCALINAIRQLLTALDRVLVSKAMMQGDRILLTAYRDRAMNALSPFLGRNIND